MSGWVGEVGGWVGRETYLSALNLFLLGRESLGFFLGLGLVWGRWVGGLDYVGGWVGG